MDSDDNLQRYRADGAGKKRACRRGGRSYSGTSHENATSLGENCGVAFGKNYRLRFWKLINDSTPSTIIATVEGSGTGAA